MNLPTLIPYPLVVAIEDCYDLDWAGDLIRALYGMDHESLRVTIVIYAEEVVSELWRQVN